MRIETSDPVTHPELIFYRRCTIDLSTGKQTFEDVPCQNLEDVLGGFGRSFQILAEREIRAAYSINNPLIINTGLLTGSSASRQQAESRQPLRDRSVLLRHEFQRIYEVGW